ncbi:MAG TPA: hypothetical protein VMW50_06925 [Dehalococcoidia bacterium]|nr:hypothetical protein [Dehalococcoidia bacterium]
MTEELEKKQGAGVGAGQATGEGAVAGQQPTAETPQPIAPAEKIDLSKSEEFRRYQAAYDSRKRELEQQLAEARRQAEEMQQQIAQVQLRDADPEQVAQYYQAQLERVQAEARQREAAMSEREGYVAQAQALLEELGIEPNTPGLDWGDEPSAAGLVRLATSAAKLKGLQAQVITEDQRTAVTGATQAARQQALQEAGVTRVNTGTGAPSSRQDNPIADITDPKELLKIAMRGTRRGGGT